MELLRSGIYTVSEASKLLRVRPERIRGWVAGYPRTKAPPVIHNEIGWLRHTLSFAFVNLMEMRFIQHFSSYGVKVNTIRRLACEAERILNHDHPFATSTVFKTDGKKIFADIAAETKDRKLYDLAAQNWAMADIIAQSLFAGAIYDPSGDISGWHPRHEAAPNVVIFPHVSFGQPVIQEHGIPTRTLAEAFHAEGRDCEAVAKWYDMPIDLVQQAVKFEMDLALAA